MSIAFYATELLSPDTLGKALVQEGIDALALDAQAIRNIETFEPGISKAVLIVPKHGAGDPTAWFRRLLGTQRDLIVCTTQPVAEGNDTLIEVGATTVIAPRSWALEHVVERILAQLILDGDVTPSTCGSLRGGTREMREAYAEMAVIAPLSDPVLILGETGTGKELFAREIHNLSRRSDKFVAINCGDLSLELASSDLFGHKKGSFTGAADTRQGLLAEAGRGTVFLDEIGELDLKAQAKLLRVLEEKTVRRVGSNQSEEVPARIVLATNRDLEFECEEGKFRQDLFERIRGFTLELKPLRERRADIPLLVQQFLAEWNREHETKVQIPPGALDGLFKYEWPGNVRELRAAVRLVAAHAGVDGYVSAWRLNQTTQRTRREKRAGAAPAGSLSNYYVAFNPRIDTWKEFSARALGAYFQALLDVTGGDKKEARHLSGLGTSQFYENLKAIRQASEKVDSKEIESDEEEKRSGPVYSTRSST